MQGRVREREDDCGLPRARVRVSLRHRRSPPSGGRRCALRCPQCEAASARGCVMSAVYRLATSARGRDARVAAEQLETAGSLGDAAGCVGRARLELEGLGTYRDEGSGKAGPRDGVRRRNGDRVRAPRGRGPVAGESAHRTVVQGRLRSRVRPSAELTRANAGRSFDRRRRRRPCSAVRWSETSKQVVDLDRLSVEGGNPHEPWVSTSRRAKTGKPFMIGPRCQTASYVVPASERHFCARASLDHAGITTRVASLLSSRSPCRRSPPRPRLRVATRRAFRRPSPAAPRARSHDRGRAAPFPRVPLDRQRSLQAPRCRKGRGLRVFGVAPRPRAPSEMRRGSRVSDRR